MSDEAERIAGGLEVLVISLRQCATLGPRLTQKTADHMERAEKLVREQIAEIASLRAKLAEAQAERDALKSIQKNEADATDFLLRFAGIDQESVTTEGGVINVGKLRIRLDELAAGIAEAQANDRRYRWLRTRVGFDQHGPYLSVANSRVSPDGTDAAIDAAMGASAND